MGRLTVVSLGPGFPDYIIPRARAALDEAQVVAGYRTYLELLQPLLTHQEVVATGMKARNAALPDGHCPGPGRGRGWPWSPAATPAFTAWPGWFWRFAPPGG